MAILTLFKKSVTLGVFVTLANEKNSLWTRCMHCKIGIISMTLDHLFIKQIYIIQIQIYIYTYICYTVYELFHSLKLVNKVCRRHVQSKRCRYSFYFEDAHRKCEVPSQISNLEQPRLLFCDS